VVQRGWRKAAVSRDDAGELHVRSAVCTHLGCCVSYNATEKWVWVWAWVCTYRKALLYL